MVETNPDYNLINTNTNKIPDHTPNKISSDKTEDSSYIINNKYKLIEIIGRGTFGVVYKG